MHQWTGNNVKKGQLSKSRAQKTIREIELACVSNRVSPWPTGYYNRNHSPRLVQNKESNRKTCLSHKTRMSNGWWLGLKPSLSAWAFPECNKENELSASTMLCLKNKKL